MVASQGSWPCSKCTWCFHSNSALERHMKTHAQLKPYSCTECDAKFAKSSGLKIHMRKHSGERPYKCDYCTKAFTTRAVLTMHRRGHTGEKPYQCKECGATFSQRSSLTIHKTLHYIDKEHKCQLCSKTFTSLKSRLKHMKNVHYTEECKICKRKFKTKEGLRYHEEGHSRESSFTCNYCDKVFDKKTTLASHIKQNHLERRYAKCDICGKLVLASYLKIHHAHAHAPNCTICGAKTRSLSQHMKLFHSGDQSQFLRVKDISRYFMKYICKTCGYRYNTNHHAIEHSKSCKGRRSIRSFSCDFCQKECETYESFVSHLNIHIESSHKTIPRLRVKDNYNPALYVRELNETINKVDKVNTAASKLNFKKVREQVKMNETINHQEAIPNINVNEQRSDHNISKENEIALQNLSKPVDKVNTAKERSNHSEQRCMKCDKCGLIILASKQKQHHMRIHEPPQCTICGVRATVLSEHMKLFHSEDESRILRLRDSGTYFKKYICKTCGYRYDRIVYAVDHKKLCWGGPKSFVSFSCDFCQKECETYASFESHVRIHIEFSHIIPQFNGKGNFNPALLVRQLNESRNALDGVAKKKQPVKKAAKMDETIKRREGTTSISVNEQSSEHAQCIDHEISAQSLSQVVNEENTTKKRLSITKVTEREKVDQTSKCKKLIRCKYVNEQNFDRNMRVEKESEVHHFSQPVNTIFQRSEPISLSSSVTQSSDFSNSSSIPDSSFSDRFSYIQPLSLEIMDSHISTLNNSSYIPNLNFTYTLTGNQPMSMNNEYPQTYPYTNASYLPNPGFTDRLAYNQHISLFNNVRQSFAFTNSYHCNNANSSDSLVNNRQISMDNYNTQRSNFTNSLYLHNPNCNERLDHIQQISTKNNGTLNSAFGNSRYFTSLNCTNGLAYNQHMSINNYGIHRSSLTNPYDFTNPNVSDTLAHNQQTFSNTKNTVSSNFTNSSNFSDRLTYVQHMSSNIKEYEEVSAKKEEIAEFSSSCCQRNSTCDKQQQKLHRVDGTALLYCEGYMYLKSEQASCQSSMSH